MKSQKQRIVAANSKVSLIAGVEYVGGGYDKFGKGIPLVRVAEKVRNTKKPKHEPAQVKSARTRITDNALALTGHGRIKLIPEESNLYRKIRHCFPRGTNFYSANYQ